jgi:hypothetical protein
MNVIIMKSTKTTRYTTHTYQNMFGTGLFSAFKLDQLILF